MIKRKHVKGILIVGACLISLAGCGSRRGEGQQVQAQMDVSDSGKDMQERLPDSSAENTTENRIEHITESTAQEETSGKTEDTGSLPQQDGHSQGEPALEETFRVPSLPDTGSGLLDFVPEGWTLWDSVELDFNEDGIQDYVGVLDMNLPDFTPPRILFAIASEGKGRYRLDFQDVNLIRTREEGGVYGDPYEPLTADGTSFATHAYGGSAWRWSETDTYTYDGGTWYKTMSESTYGYGPYITSYQKDDWRTGVGIRKERSDDFLEMEKYWDSEELWEEGFDIEYEISLEDPPTLCQAGRSWWLAPSRVEDWAVDSIKCSDDVEISEDHVKRPDERYLAYYNDEDCVLYTFQDKDSQLYCLAMYRFQDRALWVLAESDTPIDKPKVYKGKIYYTAEIVEKIAYRQGRDGQGAIAEKEGTVGMRLNRMDLDGSHKETIFEYRYPEAGQGILESWPPYLSLIYEIGGDEIVAQVYIGFEPHPFYRMGCDGSGLEKIGQIPAGE